MKKRRVLAGVILHMIIISKVMISAIADAVSQPSLVMLMERPVTFSTDESLKLFAGAAGIINNSKALRLVTVEATNMFWPDVYQALKFSQWKNADYMLFVKLSKVRGNYLYTADLMKTKENALVATYKDSWRAEPEESRKALFKLASHTIYDSSGKITVNITIISDPNYSNVYRDKDRLGNTGEKGCFTDTYWWDKGSYQIKVCKPAHDDYVEKLEVESNPNDYQREVKLKKSK